MATTSLWHIKGRLSDLIAYVENPQKTENGAFVTAINCLKQTALRQMILTKQRYGKEDNSTIRRNRNEREEREADEYYRVGIDRAGSKNLR